MSDIDRSLRVGDDPMLRGLLDEVLERVYDQVPEADAASTAEFAKAYLRRPPDEQFAELPADELFAQVKGMFEFASDRGDTPVAVRLFDPSPERDGYRTIGTVLEVNVADSPFLIDSISEEIQGRGFGVHRVVHPVVGTERDTAGRIVRVMQARGAANRESMMHFEIDRRLPASELPGLEEAVTRLLGDVALVIRDFDPMRAQVRQMVELARQSTALYEHDEIEETVAFLEWLLQDNFVFLGYREYDLTETRDGRALAVVAGSGLGILSDTQASGFSQPVPLASVPQALRTRLEGGDLLVITKTNRSSTVHRRAKMDYIGVRRVAPDGRLLGEARLLGLFTSKAYMEPASRTPLLHRKLKQILDAEDLFEGSHDHKKVITLYESFPKDELFAAPTEAIRQKVMGLLNLQEQRGVAVFVRRDLVDRSVSILVALPRDRFNAELRHTLQDLFMDRFHGASIDYHLALGEADPAQIHFTLWVADGPVPDVSFEDLEQEVIALTRTWEDRLEEELARRHGTEEARALADRWASRFPDYYKGSDNFPLIAGDVEMLERLQSAEEPFIVGLQNESGQRENLTRVALYKRDGKVQLSDVLPILEALGLRVVEEVPIRLLGGDGETFIHDFGVLGADGRQLDLGRCGERVADAVAAVWRGESESDSLNRLVIAGGMDIRQVGILRAYRTYGMRVTAGFTEVYMNDAFVANAEISALLVRLFTLAFHPEGPAMRPETEPLRKDILRRLDKVSSIDEDRILRDHLGYIDATVRTNAFKPDATSLALKLRSADVPNMPKPNPLFEIFVWATGVEAVHLRGGMVARGGLRWSDRKEDYRTEVLGLMKAQMTKNAVIVPTGSKGGFVLRRPPADPGALREEVERQYVTFMQGLLDLTDNLVDGKVAHPPHVRHYDGDDAYLVVAADKGTATLSDTANAMSAEYGFWLGDAFASGGSAGYDHKALGITARGAWESVRRHFRELGIDSRTQPFTVVGIGDMSGDVFGNGMLLSEQIRLVAAFDHRHVFLDPDPDPATSFGERKRLFELGAGTTWESYDGTLLSEGGGIHPRTSKQIPITPQVRERLGIDEGIEVMKPNELLTAILKAPVDLLWNGGIGTYVKSAEETNAQAGDRANDAIRVDGADLRCRAVGEGGNLGFTQHGRVEYAMAGGHINTDFIDNAGGVDCSDHEVNLKILLGLAEERGELDRAGRDALIDSVAGDVVEHVLYDNFLQAQILSQAANKSLTRMEAYEDLMQQLEAEGILERSVEFLPSTDDVSQRIVDGVGMVRPELAVLLAYAKRSLSAALLDSDLPDSPYLEDDLRAYFPPSVIERFGHLVLDHPLRRELVATIEANDLVNSMGVTFASRLHAETGAEFSHITRAYRIARDVTDAVARWEAIEALVGQLDPDTTNELLDGVDWLVETTARWYLPRAAEQRLADAIGSSREQFAELSDLIPEIGPEAWRADREATMQRLVDAGAPEDVARRHAYQAELVHAPDIVDVAHLTKRSVRDVARVFFLLGEAFQIDWLEVRVEHVPLGSRWQRWAMQSVESDLLLLRRQLAERVLAEAGDATPEVAVEGFVERRAIAYGRLQEFLRRLGAEGVNDLATLTVAVRQVRSLVV